jgi:hypothetical protein
MEMAKEHWFGTYWADGDLDTVPFAGTPGVDYQIGHVADLWAAIESHRIAGQNWLIAVPHETFAVADRRYDETRRRLRVMLGMDPES